MKKFLITFSAVALTSLSLFGPVSPAQAHSDQVESTPVAGSTVEAGAIPIELQFGEPLMVMDDNSVGHEIVVTNADGTEVAMSSCASAHDSTLAAVAMIDQPGTYNAYWRTVSEDGHPVEGTFEFTVVNTTNYSVDESQTVICAALISEHEEDYEEADDTNQASNQVIYIGVGVIAAVGGTVAVLISRSRRRK